MIMLRNHTHTHSQTHLHTCPTRTDICTVSLSLSLSLSLKDRHQVHTAWLPMWCSSLSFISLDRGPSELFWEIRVTLCWLLNWRDVSNSNWDLWPPPCGIQLSRLWMWVSTTIRMCLHGFILPRVHIFCMCVTVCTDGTGHDWSLTDP